MIQFISQHKLKRVQAQILFLDSRHFALIREQFVSCSSDCGGLVYIRGIWDSKTLFSCGLGLGNGPFHNLFLNLSLLIGRNFSLDLGVCIDRLFGRSLVVSELGSLCGLKVALILISLLLGKSLCNLASRKTISSTGGT